MSNKSKQPLMLAIDTSCDETSAAVTRGRIVLSNIVASQAQLHQPYGGVFPTVAKLAHVENIDRTIDTALKRAQISYRQLDAVAVTAGPGLAPALEVGIGKAKDLAQQYSKPLIAVNHIEAHALSSLLQRQSNKNKLSVKNTSWPVLSLVVSGGHSEFILVAKIGQYQRLGHTIDDAAGECLDKVGRILSLGYPAGPVIEEFAQRGDHTRFKFPLPMTTSRNYNLSFSGLKTFARNLIASLEKSDQLNKQTTYDCCASFQHAVFRHITYKLEKVLQQHPVKEVWLGGGVTANIYLRKIVRQQLKAHQLKLYTPFSKKICGDNAAMIGLVASFRFAQQQFVSNPNQLTRKPRWPITD